MRSTSSVMHAPMASQSWAAMALRNRSTTAAPVTPSASVKDGGIEPELAPGHRLEHAREGDPVERAPEPGDEVGRHRHALADGLDVPRLPTSPLEGHATMMGLGDVLAHHEHAVVGQ